MAKRRLLVILFGVCLAIMLNLGPAFGQQAAPSKIIELSFAHTIPPVVPLAKAYVLWAERVAERTGGRVKINLYWSESLVKATELYRGVQTGIADMTYYVIGIDWGLMPLNMFTKLGFMGFPSMPAGTEIYHGIREKFPQIRDEFKGVKVLASRMMNVNQIHLTKKEVRSPGDMKGLKIIALGGTFNAELAALGAAPIDVKVGDMYVALERGMADGISAPPAVLDAFGVLKLVPYHSMFQGGTCASFDLVFMNQKTWNKLPPDIQKVLEEVVPLLEQDLIKFSVAAEEKAMNAARQMNHTFINLGPEETKPWADIVQPINNKWIADTEAKGLPAKAVYEEAKTLIRGHGK